MNVGNWLRSLGLERYEAAFRDNAIDEAVLSDPKEDHLPISISMIIVSSHLVVAVADQVPKFDIVRNCKLDANPTTGLSVHEHERAV